MIPLIVALAVAVNPLMPAVAGGPPCLAPPVSGTVTDPFREPSCPYCAGNRGLEIATVPGLAVTAAASGTVTFAGIVAGTRYVVVDHGGGYRTTSGKLATVAVRTGDRVSAGSAIGTSGPVTFFGLRSGEVYLDPKPYFGTFEVRAQLVPLDGRDRRPPPVPRLRC